MNTNPRPKSAFPYTMQTTATMMHTGGCAWTADLRMHGIKVGHIEQDGRGGADVVRLFNPGGRKDWDHYVTAAFDGNEEEATFWLLLQEDALSVFGDQTNA
jgi:hypothetical protein